ncbi:hydroxyacid dehydrogenase [Streptomyces sp. NPDC058739]|uniref:hydroxyacid dehydrogenase n=1 Tax=Streptomyces sp. NPDC058739 TaxID=3346618 RepID=UPI0036CBB415
MPEPVRALIAASRASYDQQFDASHLARLRQLADLCDPPLVADLHHPRHDRLLREVQVLLSSWGTPALDRQTLDRMPRLRAVFHCAGTVRHLVKDDFWKRGILLTNAADVNAVPVAEFTFASILLAGKKAQFIARSGTARRVVWGDAPHGPFGPLTNYRPEIGIIGFSRIGRLVVERVSRGVDGATCWVVDPYAAASAVAAAGGRLTTLEYMLRRVSVLSLHAPELPETRHLIGAGQLALLPDHATVINTARGSLIDTAALEAECSSGRLNAVLDVTDPEPLPSTSVLHTLQNVSLTPHIAGSLYTETHRLTDRAIDELERFVQGRPPLSPVRRTDLGRSA